MPVSLFFKVYALCWCMSGAVANREEIRRNPQKHPSKYPYQYAEIPKQKHPKQYAETPYQYAEIRRNALSIRRNTQAKTPQAKTPQAKTPQAKTLRGLGKKRSHECFHCGYCPNSR